ncbi:hypothetical protein TNCV_3654671 [Trichonephila clavipes]|nr:hypothetical protein TNCV_3654671 [Trichonephila clavipes]
MTHFYTEPRQVSILLTHRNGFGINGPTRQLRPYGPDWGRSDVVRSGEISTVNTFNRSSKEIQTLMRDTYNCRLARAKPVWRMAPRSRERMYRFDGPYNSH